MSVRINRADFGFLRVLPAALLALAPATLAAQDGQFDLRARPSPTAAPEPTVVGPVDPESPTVRPSPQAAPTIVLPEPEQPTNPAPTASAPTSGVSARTPAARPSPARPELRTSSTSPARPAFEPGSPVAPIVPTGAATLPAPAVAAATPPPGAYQPRELGVVSRSPELGLSLGLAVLALLLLGGGWLAWTRHFRHRARALPAPVIERRSVVPASPQPGTAAPDPLPAGITGGLHLALQATRMSATLVNTTLSYRLAVTNRGAQALHDVRIAGDMISAHASRSTSELLGAGLAALPELHRIASLAPGESVTLGGDIRLPLVSITPIRRGDAALFVPLARLRAHGQDPAGATIEGGGTFLVGQEPGTSKRLQPFRLDLGPRNYSRLGQRLLPAA